MSALSLLAPAKLNLFLAITGRRSDGFHDLVSVAAPLDFGDRLQASPAPDVTLRCSDPEVPVDDSNLIVKAGAAHAEALRRKGVPPVGAAFVLEKRIPMGAGLGGGSSDAVAALRALNRLAPPEAALSAEELHRAASALGSDCPLFLASAPVVMRGRGEQVAPLPATAVRRLTGRRVLVFKPAFGIATPWAYAQLAARAPASYLPAEEAEARLSRWLGDPRLPAEALLYNTMEAAAFTKYVALPVLLDQLREKFELQPRMSGSGSACFALLPEDFDAAPAMTAIRDAWGDSALIQEARLA